MAKKMIIKTQMDEPLLQILRKVFRGQDSYPLEGRQCLHWAKEGRDDLLVLYLPGLQKALAKKGHLAASAEVGSIIEEVNRTRISGAS